jgi:hypothetical protein
VGVCGGGVLGFYGGSVGCGCVEELTALWVYYPTRKKVRNCYSLLMEITESRRMKPRACSYAFAPPNSIIQKWEERGKVSNIKGSHLSYAAVQSQEQDPIASNIPRTAISSPYRTSRPAQRLDFPGRERSTEVLEHRKLPS